MLFILTASRNMASASQVLPHQRHQRAIHFPHNCLCHEGLLNSVAVEFKAALVLQALENRTARIAMADCLGRLRPADSTQLGFDQTSTNSLTTAADFRRCCTTTLYAYVAACGLQCSELAFDGRLRQTQFMFPRLEATRGWQQTRMRVAIPGR